MEATMILNKEIDTYNMKYDVISEFENLKDLNNKLFCTFTNLDGLDNLVSELSTKYSIIYNNIAYCSIIFIILHNII